MVSVSFDGVDANLFISNSRSNPDKSSGCIKESISPLYLIIKDTAFDFLGCKLYKTEVYEDICNISESFIIPSSKFSK